MDCIGVIKFVIQASNQYNKSPSEHNLLQLHSQLDVLISMMSNRKTLKLFNPYQIIPTECLACLMEILNNSNSPTELCSKAMILLFNLAADHDICKVLQTTFNVTALLASFLKEYTGDIYDEAVLQCVQLLQRVTYQSKIVSPNNYIESLIKFLVSNIQVKETRLTLPCLGLMANLCRNSIEIQSHIKAMDDLKLLYMTVMRYLSHSNLLVVTSSLSILTSLVLHEEYGKPVFSDQNIKKTFLLIFNILVNADETMIYRYTVDLFIDLLKAKQIQDSIAIFEHFERCLREILKLLKQNNSEVSSKILELVLAFCGVPNLRNRVCQIIMSSQTVQDEGYNVQNAAGEPFFMLVQWACKSVSTHDQVSLKAIEVLREMNEEIIDSGSTIKLSLRLDVTLPMAIELLTCQEPINSPVMLHHCLKLIQVVALLKTLCTDENAKSHVAQCLDLQVLKSILEFQMNHNPVGLSMSQRSDQSPDWSDAGVDLVFHVLDLMYKVRDEIPATKQHIFKVLQNQLFVPFLAYALTSTTRERIHISLQLLSISMGLPDFPLTHLGESITGNNNEKFEALQRPLMPVRAVSPHQVNNNGIEFGAWGQQRPVQPSESQMESLIEKMKTGMDLKDTRASEIMGIYEQKLATFETKESHLQDLLEAKALALSQADRLIAEYRCRRAQADVEARKMRLLLQECENSIEQYKEEINESVLEKENLEKQCRDAETWQQENKKKLKSLEDELHKEKDEHSNLQDVHGVLKKHADDLESQLEKGRLRIKEQEEIYESLEKEHEDLQTEVEKLCQELSQAQEEKREYKRQVSSLEAKQKKTKTDLASKDQIIKKLTVELEKHDQITQMIHKLTGADK